MRHGRLTALVAVGILLTAPTAAAGPAAAPDRARAAKVAIVPLAATEQISRSVLGADGALTDANETNHLYRDSAGRTRYETGSTVTISDPAAGTTVRLDTKSRTYTSAAMPKRPAKDAPSQLGPKEQQISSAPRALGTATVAGVRAEGTAYTVTLQREGAKPLTKDVEVWLDKDIQLDVRTRIVEPSGEEYTKTYSEIRTGAEPDDALFAVPAGYQAADAIAAAEPIDCPVSISPDPLYLVSYGPFFDGRSQTGQTDFPNAGCLIAATAAVVQAPLWAYPVTPYLGLPYFEWFFYDDGGPVPYDGYIAFGSAGFLAYSTDDTTEKWSLVILYVFV